MTQTAKVTPGGGAVFHTDGTVTVIAPENPHCAADANPCIHAIGRGLVKTFPTIGLWECGLCGNGGKYRPKEASGTNHGTGQTVHNG